MSIFSSLILFYPGQPPPLKLHELRAFCDQLRKILALRDVYLGVNIKYGKSIDQDLESTNKINWDESGIIGQTVSYDWDYKKQNLPWPELWPKVAFDSRRLYRAYVNLGSLPKPVITELTAMRDRETTYEFIVPDSISVQIDPVCPATLSSETEDTCCGFVELSFSGNGFFTWQPLSRYWEAVRGLPTIPRLLRLCRETFPVPALADDDLDRLKSHLGELFLNRNDYQQGDWIVSVSETG
jgi:hypothetical protein